MNYKLNTREADTIKEPIWVALARLVPLMRGEGGKVAIAFAAILMTSGLALAAPLIISHIIDSFITTRHQQIKE